MAGITSGRAPLVVTLGNMIEEISYSSFLVIRFRHWFYKESQSSVGRGSFVTVVWDSHCSHQYSPSIHLFLFSIVHCPVSPLTTATLTITNDADHWSTTCDESEEAKLIYYNLDGQSFHPPTCNRCVLCLSQSNGDLWQLEMAITMEIDKFT